MYCKSKLRIRKNTLIRVLIVAKCIVNFISSIIFELLCFVLIVAKCIVNTDKEFYQKNINRVLIVAKCIVNVNLPEITTFVIMY